MSISKKTIFFILLILIVLVVDQSSKFWVKTNMYIGESRDVLSWFKISFVENEGMAFGMKLFSKLFLSIFRIIASIAIIIFSIKIIKKQFPLGFILSIGLILAGAIGNLIDCAFYGMIFNSSDGNVASFLLLEQPENAQPYASFLYGNVVDMLSFPIIKDSHGETIFFSPVFNVADSAVTVGVAIIFIFFRVKFNDALDSISNPFKSPGYRKFWAKLFKKS